MKDGIRRLLDEARREHHKQLWLGHERLKTVPEDVREFHWLESLDLERSGIRSLPDWLLELPNLKEVNAFDNPLEYVPESLPVMADWSAIEKLGLQESHVLGVRLDAATDELPEQLLSWSGLKRLECGPYFDESKPAKWLEVFLERLQGCLPKLEVLNLSYCGLKCMPDGLSRLRHLKNLSLSGNNLGQVPECIREIPSLQVLYVGNCDLRAVPDWLFSLPDLRRLGLGGNPLFTLPQSLRQATRLQSLDLSDTPLASLPDGLAALQRLEIMSLPGTLLSIPAPVFGLHRLRLLALPA